MPDHLEMAALANAAGEIEEGRTIELKLDDGRVIVARVRQIQTGPIECPIADCFRRFDSERGRKTHIGKMHPEERLLANEQFADEPGDAAYAIDRLLARGWFYEVEGDLCFPSGRPVYLRSRPVL